MVESIPLGKSPFGVTATSDGLVYVANFGESSVLDSGNPQSISITSDGSRAYVSSSNAARAWVIDTSSLKIVGTINVEGQSNGVAVSP